MNDEPEIRRRQSGLVHRLAHALEHTLLGRIRHRRNLAGKKFAAMFHRNVGKGAANISGEMRFCHRGLED